MEFILSYTFFICVGLYNVHFSKAIEPTTCSKFPYEEQTLEKMIRTEIKVEMMVNEIKTTQDNVLNTLRDIKQTVANFSDKFLDLRENITEEMTKKGEQIKQREELSNELFEETRANLSNTVDNQRKTIVQLQEAFRNQFEDTKANLTNAVEDQRKTLVELQEVFQNKFEETKAKLTNTVDDEMKTSAQLQETFRTQFEETKAMLTKSVDDQRKTIVQLQGKLGKLDRPSIAFYAYHVNDKKLDTPNEVIIFDKTFINEGTGYDTTTGIFTAPIGGVYQFTVHTCKYPSKKTTIGLVLEGRLIAGNINSDTDNYDCNTLGALVRVKSGQKVWVKATSYGSAYQLYRDSWRMNTFSGLLVNN